MSKREQECLNSTDIRSIFREYRIVVYAELDCQDMYDGNVPSSKRVNLLYVRRHRVITNLTHCKTVRAPGMYKSCRRDVTHVCKHSCSDCMSIPPCVGEEGRVGYPCDECNRHFRSRTCFDKHKINKMMGKKKTVCEGKRRCRYVWQSARVKARIF